MSRRGRPLNELAQSYPFSTLRPRRAPTPRERPSAHGPARTVKCALSIVQGVQPLGLEVRAGVHASEIEMRAGKAGGMAVVVGARLGALAGPSEVLVSQTVKDLTIGSGVHRNSTG